MRGKILGIEALNDRILPVDLSGHPLHVVLQFRLTKVSIRGLGSGGKLVLPPPMFLRHQEIPIGNKVTHAPALIPRITPLSTDVSPTSSPPFKFVPNFTKP